MRKRCYDPNDPGFANYGGRGIKFCERWKDFATFLADMGPRPPGCSLDRIDNEGNYELGNCRWATQTEQNRNKRNNRLITLHGETLCVADWAAKLKMKKVTLEARLLLGWSVERALTEPVHKNGRTHG